MPALMPMTKRAEMHTKIESLCDPKRAGGKYAPDYTKNTGGSWFAVAHNTTSGHGRNPDGRKVPSESGRRTDIGNGARFTSRDCGIENSIANAQDGCKQRGSGHAWYRGEVGSKSSKSTARKAASAQIAKIPFVLSQHIARVYYPETV